MTNVQSSQNSSKEARRLREERKQQRHEDLKFQKEDRIKSDNAAQAKTYSDAIRGI